MTPLQLLAAVLAERHGCSTPLTDAAPELRAWLVLHAESAREQEVVDYFIAASDGTLGDKGGHSSLKHILWSLRDLDRNQFRRAGAAVLNLVPDRRDIVLSRINQKCLTRTLAQANCAQVVARIFEASDPEDLLNLVQVTQAGPWLVGTTTSPRNLLGLVMRHTDADLYVAASEKGSVNYPTDESGGLRGEISKPGVDQSQPPAERLTGLRYREVPRFTPWGARASPKLCNSEAKQPYGVEGSAFERRPPDNIDEAHFTGESFGTSRESVRRQSKCSEYSC